MSGVTPLLPSTAMTWAGTIVHLCQYRSDWFASLRLYQVQKFIPLRNLGPSFAYISCFLMHTDFCPLRPFSAVVVCRIFIVRAGPAVDPQIPALKNLLQ